jgi:opacity protein-like surface antigen
MNRTVGARSFALAAALAVAATSAPIASAAADDLIGFYVGGAIGQARVAADAGDFQPGTFRENHSAYALTAGIRPISPFGVEVSYVDFGHPTGLVGNGRADVTMKGAAAFGVFYLPIPIIDVYAKAGLARLESTVTGLTPVQPDCIPCAPSLFSLSRTNTSFAAGVGAQYRFGALAVRTEYERFNAAGANPGLVTLGLTWTFF